MSIENISVKSKEELEQMVTNEMGQIEKGLSIVCSQVPIDDQSKLDILCHDDNGQLVVVQLNIEEDDKMLFQGIQSLDYVEKFKSFLKATYNKHKIDEETKPRLILVAPSFSETLHHTVEHLEGMRIDLYEWEYLKIGDHKGLRLQPIFPKKPPVKKPEWPKKKEETKKEPATSSHKKEEKKEEPEEKESKPKFEQPKKELPEFPKPFKEREEKKKEAKPPKKEEPPKRKLKLF
ncbi:MAG: endonuclease NucS [Candidatus Bathyarchaeota archaeon]|jgi:hypothetical protein